MGSNWLQLMLLLFLVLALNHVIVLGAGVLVVIFLDMFYFFLHLTVFVSLFTYLSFTFWLHSWNICGLSRWVNLTPGHLIMMSCTTKRTISRRSYEMVKCFVVYKFENIIQYPKPIMLLTNVFYLFQIYNSCTKHFASLLVAVLTSLVMIWNSLQHLMNRL